MALQQTQKTKPKNGRGKWLEMLAFPPAILAPVLFIALLTREAYEVAELSIPVLASFLFLYTGLSFAYLTLRKKGQRNAAWAAAILADALREKKVVFTVLRSGLKNYHLLDYTPIYGRE